MLSDKLKRPFWLRSKTYDHDGVTIEPIVKTTIVIRWNINAVTFIDFEASGASHKEAMNAVIEKALKWEKKID